MAPGAQGASHRQGTDDHGRPVHAGQTVWCVAKVSACKACASSSNTSTCALLAVRPMRSTMAAEQSTSQAGKLMRGSQRDCVKNQPISTTTDKAQSKPIMLLL